MEEANHNQTVAAGKAEADRNLRFIIAGGGTGGHIFPAIAIANALKKQAPGSDLLFIGAKGKMEMEKVPAAGYRIEGLDIAGFNRSSLIKNIGLPWKLLRSFLQVRRILNRFQPTAVIGVGGYSSFPVLRYAQAKGWPSFIHESNSFAGKSNKMLGKKATRIFTAARGMEAFFPADRIEVTGNPVRQSIVNSKLTRAEGLAFFGLDPHRKTVLVTGGSLGALGINSAIGQQFEALTRQGIQLIWQTGKPYAQTARERTAGNKAVWTSDFIAAMEYAYAAADVVVSRAGAMAIAELAVALKPTVFVPYPFAAEDHQTANAMELVKQGAAAFVKDSEAMDRLMPVLLELVNNEDRQNQFIAALKKIRITDADDRIARAILNNCIR